MSTRKRLARRRRDERAYKEPFGPRTSSVGCNVVLGRAAKLGRVGLLDRLLRRRDATETGMRARTPESEHSGEGDQRTLDSESAENIVDASRIPGEGEEPDRAPRSQ